MMFIDRIFTSVTSVTKPSPNQKIPLFQGSTIRVTPLVAIYAYNDKKDRNKPIPSYRLTQRSTPCVSHNSKHSSSRS
nr:MAG TPA: hypothetical protein [Caudoviricetes sp.]